MSVQIIEPPDKGYWRMRDGNQILIKDMSDSHLSNAIKMVLRAAKSLYADTKNAAEQFEAACDNTWSLTLAELNDFIEHGSYSDFLPDVYFDLLKEFKRRQTLTD